MGSRIDQLKREINNAFGEGTVFTGNDERLTVKYLPTGLLPIDVLLRGGLPAGRMVELTGNFSTLKSYIGLHAIKTTQQNGGFAALIDTEHAYDPEWAGQIGVMTEDLLLQQPATGELAMDTAETLIRSGMDLIVFDSVAATLPQQEANKRLHGETTQPGRLADLMSRGLRKMTAANSRTAVLWVNQLREQIGVTFGNPEKPTGGRALGFYDSIRMNIRKAGKVTREVRTFTGDKYTKSRLEIAQTFRAFTEKSKLDRPGQEVYFDYRLTEPVGIDAVKFLFSYGVSIGVVKQKGRTWSYGDVQVVGMEKFLAKLSKDGDALVSLENAIRKNQGLPLLPHHGKRVAGKKSAASSKGRSSGSGASGCTPARDRAGSSSTALTRPK